jgi:propanol-preferring alcohol dehydrogenase
MAIPKTMKAAVVEKFRGPLVMQELPVPAPGPGQALVEIMASGVCHTDLHAADGDWPVKPGLPITPGHEGAGIGVALGPGVTHLKEGDRVGIGCKALAVIVPFASQVPGRPVKSRLLKMPRR